jgi:hypothetical protein
MTRALTIETEIHFEKCRKGQRVMQRGPALERPKGRLPRITRLMALAIRCERLIREGEIADYAELARLGQVTRARVTQIMNLLLLAPDIQEAILLLPRVTRGDDPIVLRDLQAITATADWSLQRRMWGAA